jgi:predicted AAA+ superfamily ATPase
MYKFNPFRPNSLVSPGIFTGRVEECVALEKLLFQTKNGNPGYALLYGERGIGKSSLLFVHELTAKGELNGFESARFNFLTVTIILEPSDTYQTIIRKLGAGLSRTIASHNKAQELAKKAWDFINRLEVMGVKYRATPEEAPSELLDELAQAYTTTCDDICGFYDGILVLIDEADKPPANAHLGALVKGLTERTARSQSNKVSLALAGADAVLQNLRESHESALRVFTTYHLKPLSWDECIEVLRKGLKDAAERNQFETRISPEAEHLLAFYSEGYPHFIQQFGYCAFAADTDNEIDREDVPRGAWAEHGAFDQLGTKYFEGLYFEQINSNDYRQVLRFMAERLDGWVSKEEIRRAVHLKESTLNNALQALKNRRIILPQPGQPGSFRLPLKSFAAWIKAYTLGPNGTDLPNLDQDNSTRRS